MTGADALPIKTDHWQLFLDDYVLARTTGLDRVVHHPRPMGVVIPADRPWETLGVQPLYVGRKDDGSFFAFYTSIWWDFHNVEGQDRAHHHVNGVAYAVSADGITWTKPDLGIVEAPAEVDREKHYPFPTSFGSTRANNLGVPFTIVADLGQYGNVTDPNRRFALKLVRDAAGVAPLAERSEEELRGYFAPEIPDFLNDPDWRDKLIDSGGCFDTRRHLVHFWDDLHEEWVAMEQGAVPHWLPSREIGRHASKDLINWTSESVLYPDCADSHSLDCYDEAMLLHPFCAEGVVFGMLSWFHSDRSHPDAGPIFEATPGHPVVWPWVRKGTNDMRITISRDGGKTWDRTVSREPWIPHGTEQDSYDRMVIGPHPPVRVGDEDWFYLNVTDGDHLFVRNNAGQDSYYSDRVAKHQIALYIQKHNRYVSLTARARQETLITRPIVVPGGSLRLNLDASHGEVRVGVALADPIPTYDGTTPTTAAHMYEYNQLPGFTFDDCVPLNCNHTEAAALFKGEANLDSLRGKPVRLLFRMFDADIYGFKFGGDR